MLSHMLPTQLEVAQAQLLSISDSPLANYCLLAVS